MEKYTDGHAKVPVWPGNVSAKVLEEAADRRCSGLKYSSNWMSVKQLAQGSMPIVSRTGFDIILVIPEQLLDMLKL